MVAELEDPAAQGRSVRHLQTHEHRAVTPVLCHGRLSELRYDERGERRVHLDVDPDKL
jgi:hypothetical protein